MKISEAIPGARVGRLTIIETFKGLNDKRTRARCVCDCGGEISPTVLNLGVYTNSCGCIKKEVNHQRCYRSPLHKTVSSVHSYTHHVTKNCDLTRDVIEQLVTSSCFYCGRPPEICGSRGAENSKRMGLDRVNNDVGYVSNNVVPCCFQCNRVKSNHSLNIISEKFPQILENVRILSKAPDVTLLQNKLEKIVERNADGCFRIHRNKFSRADVVSKNKFGRIKYNFSYELFRSLIFSGCFYCGGKLEDVGTRCYTMHCRCGILAIGVDRIDSKRGYESDNIIQCCQFCNYLKNDLSLLQLEESLSGIINGISQRSGLTK